MSSQFVFSAETSSGGRELWVTDGTSEGTHLLTDINPNGSSNPGSRYFQSEGGNSHSRRS
jgi:ELWxxDGT repeat protein